MKLFKTGPVSWGDAKSTPLIPRTYAFSVLKCNCRTYNDCCRPFISFQNFFELIFEPINNPSFGSILVYQGMQVRGLTGGPFSICRFMSNIRYFQQFRGSIKFRGIDVLFKFLFAEGIKIKSHCFGRVSSGLLPIQLRKH